MPERVCEYPRPPALQASSQHIVVRAFGQLLAETQASFRVLETFHPPTYYLPAASFAEGALVPAGGRSFCEWKGIASYFDIAVGDRCLAGPHQDIRVGRAFYGNLTDHQGDGTNLNVGVQNREDF